MSRKWWRVAVEVMAAYGTMAIPPPILSTLSVAGVEDPVGSAGVVCDMYDGGAGSRAGLVAVEGAWFGCMT